MTAMAAITTATLRKAGPAKAPHQEAATSASLSVRMVSLLAGKSAMMAASQPKETETAVRLTARSRKASSATLLQASHLSAHLSAVTSIQSKESNAMMVT